VCFELRVAWLETMKTLGRLDCPSRESPSNCLGHIAQTRARIACNQNQAESQRTRNCLGRLAVWASLFLALSLASSEPARSAACDEGLRQKVERAIKNLKSSDSALTSFF